jgi:hypothetical protein
LLFVDQVFKILHILTFDCSASLLNTSNLGLRPYCSYYEAILPAPLGPTAHGSERDSTRIAVFELHVKNVGALAFVENAGHEVGGAGMML